MLDVSAIYELIKQIINSKGKLEIVVKMYKNIKTLKQLCKAH